MTIGTMTDKQKAAAWARQLLERDNFIILDTETTGLGNEDEICQIAAIYSDGKTLVNSFSHATCDISLDATAIHGIRKTDLFKAPDFPYLFMDLWKGMAGRDVVIYNAEFDLRMIRQSLKPYDIQAAFPMSDRRGCRIFTNGGAIHCAMLWYSQWIGEWNDYHGNYRWQKLPGGDHSALGDCKATLEIIKKMAASLGGNDGEAA